MLDQHCIHSSGKTASVDFDVQIFSRIRNPGEDFIHQAGNFPFRIRFYQIMQGTNLKSFQGVVCGSGSKNQQTVGIGLTQDAGCFHTIGAVHINIQKRSSKRTLLCSCKKDFAIFIFEQVSGKLTAGNHGADCPFVPFWSVSCQKH